MSKNQRNGSNSVATAGGPAEVSAVPAENEELKKATDPAALADGPSYVRAVAAQVDLVGASAKLIVSTDEKIVKAELDRLRELIFGKGGPAPSDEALRIDWSSMTRSASDSGSGAEKSAELPEGELHGRH